MKGVKKKKNDMQIFKLLIAAVIYGSAEHC